LLREGVRIIIGHHPHVVQPVVIERDAEAIKHVVFYSLGNFISNQQQKYTDGGMLAEIVLSRKEPASPVVIEKCGYEFVWVQKRWHNKKAQYRLVPSWDVHKPIMDEAEKQKMDIFVRQAEKIVLQDI
jgi:poly-gamma-glutamate synthesis protein (capsule biosynthesis protein)